MKAAIIYNVSRIGFAFFQIGSDCNGNRQPETENADDNRNDFHDNTSFLRFSIT
uniref:Uncharacterized protein n=1 Tax=Siphoviridae sp. ctx254 TaxID=2825737 RepID=A0A8S5TVT9_9CAUD|nr:MAG TPA: hypothetical protein [Siphoviridae sp. ctx254]